MTHYYNNETLCIEGGWLVESGIMALGTYDNYYCRKNSKYRDNRLQVGGNGRPSLIEYASIPERFKTKIKEVLGYDPVNARRHQIMRGLLAPCTKAKDFFENYRRPSGAFLKPEKIKEHKTNAMFLAAIARRVGDISSRRKTMGGRLGGTWTTVVKEISDLQDEYGHTLPLSESRLREKVKKYVANGPKSLIHGGEANTNSLKVDEKTLNLILSIASRDINPFVTLVHASFERFMKGEEQIMKETVDESTGEIIYELYDPADFRKNGKPLTLSEGAVWHHMRNLENDGLLKKKRLSASDFTLHEMPFAKRITAEFALAKVSMDDRTLPRKSEDKGWVNVYYAADVASQVYLANVYVYGRPDVPLVLECFREMYRFLSENNLYWPAEVEVEHFLMSGIRDALEEMFDYVRFCNPGNSREKRMEHLIRVKKYTDEVRYQSTAWRWSGKGAYKLNEDRKEKLSADQVVADDIESVKRHNNALHPNQKKYPGMSRMQVLMTNLHPDLARPNKFRLARHIGFPVETSVQNKNHVRVQYGDYWIDFNALGRMKPNSKSVDAYYIPNSKGIINEVFLYQGDDFICRADKVESFREAMIERTDRDNEIMLGHQKRQATRRKMIKEGVKAKISKIEITPATGFDVPEVDMPDHFPETGKTIGERDEWEELANKDYGYMEEQASMDL